MDEFTLLAFETITGVAICETATYRVVRVPVDELVEIVVVQRTLEPPDGAGARRFPDPFNRARFTRTAAQLTRGM